VPVTSANGCRTATITSSSTSPSLSDLNGAIFAGFTSPTRAIVTRFRVTGVGHELIARWRLASQVDVIGFILAATPAHGYPHRLNRQLIPVHASRMYTYRIHRTVPGPYRLMVVLRSGRAVNVRTGG
jgi:hypothetical protein